MKHCIKCGTSKPTEDFAWRNIVKGWRSPWCRGCMKAYDKERYKNPEYKLDARRRGEAARQQGREYISDYRKSHPCVDCGNSDPRVLDFDHLRDKDYNVANMWGLSVARIQKEIDKCEMRCANCHRIVTCERRNQ